MRKFELIKEYPGSWVIGTVFEFNTNSDRCLVNGITSNTPAMHVQNNEYYKEIIEKPEYVKCITDHHDLLYELNKIYKVFENSDYVMSKNGSNGFAYWNNKSKSKFEPSTKEAYDEQNKPQLDYEILGFKLKNVPNAAVLYKLANGNFRRTDLTEPTAFQGHTLEYLLNPVNRFDIHSIKRLSDGEVFTIGDKVDIYSSIETIEEFSLGMYGDNFCRIKVNGKSSYLLENVDKVTVKPVLFTTHDGVDIITKGRLYCCYKTGYVKKLNKEKDIPFVYNLHNVSYMNNTDFYFFSTKEACQAYIDDVTKTKEQPKTDLITVQLTKEKYDLLMQLLEE